MFSRSARSAVRRGVAVRPVLLLATVAALALPGTAAAEAGDADAALAQALALFEPAQARALYGEAARPDGRETTLVLRDLAAGLDELSPRQRAIAQRILARPTDRNDPIKPYRSKARSTCDARMCFWWVSEGADAPPRADRNRNRVPDWVETTRAVFRKVWIAEVRSRGYRRPLSDLRSRNHGRNGKLDVYLADVGGRGIYGYCTSDDPRRARSFAVSAYCVVDDDFSRRQFSAGTSGRRALEVTAAHEFFHAVQFAYDWLEDRWLMEGTASWMEDEVYPTINDNLQYLPSSPVSRNLFWLPLDGWNPDGSSPQSSFVYGTWIFWRHLDERFGAAVVRDVWNRVRGAPFAIQAVNAALMARGTTFGDVFPAFGVANFTPETSYAEGPLYRTVRNVGPVPSATYELTSAAPAVNPAPIEMPHMSNDYYGFVPGPGLTAASTLAVRVTTQGVGGAANLIVFNVDGTRTVVPVPIFGGTSSLTTVPFGLGVVSRVTLVLTNASTRFDRCGDATRPPYYSCYGFPVDDHAYTFTATATPDEP
jgi:hypothetical protein